MREAMVVLRATQKVLKLLPHVAACSAVSTTALGDWYVNRMVVDRRPLLLLVSSASLLTLVTAARDVKSLPHRLAELIEERLQRLGVAENCVASEVEEARDVTVAKTIDRSVTGQLVDFAKMLPSYLPEVAWNEEHFKFAEDRLAEAPCRAKLRFDDVIFPRKTAIRLLEGKWTTSVIHQL